MKTCWLSAVCFLACAAAVWGQDGKIRMIAFGAHPDDAEIKAGGIGAKFAAKGHLVKLVSVTNGDAGHCEMSGAALARRRNAESQEVAKRLGIAAYEVLDHHDGELLPTLDIRNEIIRLIREWKADIVLAPRPNDYHPDHRYTGILIQDAAFMVIVPMVVPLVPHLTKNPVFFYYEDGFQKPAPFQPDIAVDIGDVWEKKLDAFEADASQFYEAQPCWAGITGEVPKGAAERRQWLAKRRGPAPTPAVRQALEKWYGAERGSRVVHAEALELCEYGSRPTPEQLRRLFPFFD